MRNGRTVAPRLVLLLLFFLASVTARALDPGQTPGGNFDLTHWKLQLPTSGGVLTGTSGSVDEITPAQLEAGFTNAYFYTGSDGSMVFWAPDNGARTSGSDHPRSELRERINPGNDGTNWVLYGTHILNAQCKVWQIPSDTKKVIIGQIHAVNSLSNLPTVKIQYNNGVIEGTIKTNSTDDNSDKKFTYATVGLSNNITYQIKVVNGLISIVVNGVTNSLNVFQSDPAYTNVQQYFKAGSYNQSTNQCNCSTDGARVAFYAVTLFHAPSITNQPASQTVLVGSNVTFTVGATGNPPLRYFWQFNGTAMSNKTNATLSIPSVQLTNAGNYSVIITDCVGSVTSVATSTVATLTVIPPAPAASFTASPTNGVIPLNVAFTDTSTGLPTNWAWDFGDAGTSALQNPSHNYSTAGVYTVRLIASNTGGSSTNTKINLITALPPPPVAGFIAGPTSGAAPLTVTFTDSSSGSITSWAWAFGNGHTSTSQNPSDTYSNPGAYTVQEIVSGPGGSSTDTVANLIGVYDPFAWWQFNYFGATNNPNAGPDGDSTGTGMSNTNKFLAGFNPTNPAAYLHIMSVAITNTTDINVAYLGADGDSTLSPGITSRTNVLEFTVGTPDGGYLNDFASANVTNILSGGTGTGIVTNMIDTGGATNTPSRYYRVRVLVP